MLALATPSSGQSEGIWLSGVGGNKLNDICTTWTSANQYDPCTAYIEGLVDGLAGAGRICLTEAASTKQAVYMVVKRLRDHPEDWALHAFWITEKALKPTFACRK
jgi:hypothetical protein